ncbi:MAG: presqualene diphosphate synthase HpnD [Alphaproteobacteria bacterium]|nr:presqualene diphosphate synthase HpnD [Alphaproteobacteria bacterium]
MTVSQAESCRTARDHVRGVVDRSGSSFGWSMRTLPLAQREAMYAVYAFCREVDDIADEPGDPVARARELERWRDEIDAVYAGSPTRPTGVALAGAVKSFALPKYAFAAIIDGMAMDLRGDMTAPTEVVLSQYCDRVAGAVGRLSLTIFGGADSVADELAHVLGEALQFTNILRDLGEDAQLDRLYLPRERLRAHGIEANDPATVLAHPNIGAVCAEVARHARNRFAESAALVARADSRLKPVRMMIAVYEGILSGLEQRGWGDPGAPYRLPRRTKLWIALRHGIF